MFSGHQHVEAPAARRTAVGVDRDRGRRRALVADRSPLVDARSPTVVGRAGHHHVRAGLLAAPNAAATTRRACTPASVYPSFGLRSASCRRHARLCPDEHRPVDLRWCARSSPPLCPGSIAIVRPLRNAASDPDPPLGGGGGAVVAAVGGAVQATVTGGRRRHRGRGRRCRRERRRRSRCVVERDGGRRDALVDGTLVPETSTARGDSAPAVPSREHDGRGQHGDADRRDDETTITGDGARLGRVAVRQGHQLLAEELADLVARQRGDHGHARGTL